MNNTAETAKSSQARSAMFLVVLYVLTILISLLAAAAYTGHYHLLHWGLYFLVVPLVAFFLSASVGKNFEKKGLISNRALFYFILFATLLNGYLPREEEAQGTILKSFNNLTNKLNESASNNTDPVSIGNNYSVLYLSSNDNGRVVNIYQTVGFINKEQMLINSFDEESFKMYAQNIIKERFGLVVTIESIDYQPNTYVKKGLKIKKDGYLTVSGKVEESRPGLGKSVFIAEGIESGLSFERLNY